MLLGIDHIVIAVADPDAVAREIEARCGLAAGGGGRHERLGTFNRLVWLGDSYLELIGVFDRALAADSWIGRPTLEILERGGGIATWALATDDIAAEVNRLRARGLQVDGPLDGERRRPDGRIVRWRLAIPGPLGPTRGPFIIEHDTAAAEWTPAEREERGASRHPIGAPARLVALDLAVGDPVPLTEDLAGLLSELPDAWPAGEVDLGNQRLRLVDEGTPALHIAVEAQIEPRVVEVAACRFDLRPSPRAVSRPA